MDITTASLPCVRFHPGGPPCSARCRFHFLGDDDGYCAEDHPAIATVTALVLTKPGWPEIEATLRAIAVDYPDLGAMDSDVRWSVFDAVAAAGGADWNTLYDQWIGS